MFFYADTDFGVPSRSNLRRLEDEARWPKPKLCEVTQPGYGCAHDQCGDAHNGGSYITLKLLLVYFTY